MNPSLLKHIKLIEMTGVPGIAQASGLLSHGQ
jgi:hypothetical protein